MVLLAQPLCLLFEMWSLFLWGYAQKIINLRRINPLLGVFSWVQEAFFYITVVAVDFNLKNLSGLLHFTGVDSNWGCETCVYNLLRILDL